MEKAVVEVNNKPYTLLQDSDVVELIETYMGNDFAHYIETRLQDDYKAHAQEIKDYQDSIDEKEETAEYYLEALRDIQCELDSNATKPKIITAIQRIIDNII